MDGTNTPSYTNAAAYAYWAISASSPLMTTASCSQVTSNVFDFTFAPTNLNYVTQQGAVYGVGITGLPFTYMQGGFTIKADPMGSGASSLPNLTVVDWNTILNTGNVPWLTNSGGVSTNAVTGWLAATSTADRVWANLTFAPAFSALPWGIITNAPRIPTNAAQISGLGALAFSNGVTIGNVSGLGSLASSNSLTAANVGAQPAFSFLAGSVITSAVNRATTATVWTGSGGVVATGSLYHVTSLAAASNCTATATTNADGSISYALTAIPAGGVTWPLDAGGGMLTNVGAVNLGRFTLDRDPIYDCLTLEDPQNIPGLYFGDNAGNLLGGVGMAPWMSPPCSFLSSRVGPVVITDEGNNANVLGASSYIVASGQTSPVDDGSGAGVQVAGSGISIGAGSNPFSMPIEGCIYYDSTSHTLCMYNGTSWGTLNGGAGVSYTGTSVTVTNADGSLGTFTCGANGLMTLNFVDTDSDQQTLYFPYTGVTDGDESYTDTVVTVGMLANYVQWPVDGSNAPDQFGSLTNIGAIAFQNSTATFLSGVDDQPTVYNPSGGGATLSFDSGSGQNAFIIGDSSMFALVSQNDRVAIFDDDSGVTAGVLQSGAIYLGAFGMDEGLVDDGSGAALQTQTISINSTNGVFVTVAGTPTPGWTGSFQTGEIPPRTVEVQNGIIYYCGE